MARSMFASAMTGQRVKFTIAFHGENFHGWKRQRSGNGVQNFLETALAQVTGRNCLLESSSRTDSGVHARGLVAHGDVPAQVEISRLALALNSQLPLTIRVLSAETAAPDFHARFDAIRKEYRYHIWHAAAANPLRLHDTWHIPQALDLTQMRHAAEKFLGTHDFTAFTSNRGGKLGDPVRTITRCTVTRSGSLVTLRITGSGFLYKMCRAMTGTLAAVGRGKIFAEEIPVLFAGKSRGAVPMNAPAHGLILWQVNYR